MARAHKSRFDSRERMPKLEVEARGLSPYEDAYHWILTRSWPRFFATVTVVFVLLNAAFAGVYSLQPGAIRNANGFADRFFFSVQTLGTIGFGGMVPATYLANVVVTIEALVGLLFTALVTGLTFARFARPTARIMFSDKAVIGPRDGVPHLMFRMANYRRNRVAEATLHALLLVAEKTAEGDVLRRPHPLPLVLGTNYLFSHSWTAMHRIDESSPFFGDGAMERLRSGGVEIYLTLTGVDETLAQTIHARARYTLDDVVPNARFADILRVKPDGTRVVDYERFHDVILDDRG